jgi:hypothetical protein
MSGMSRRDLLRASAGAAAVAVPMSVLSSQEAGASRALQGAQDSKAAHVAAAAAAAPESAVPHELRGPVMFSVRDARAGEVSILHGDAEVIVHDRQLVDRILRAAGRVVA